MKAWLPLVAALATPAFADGETPPAPPPTTPAPAPTPPPAPPEAPLAPPGATPPAPPTTIVPTISDDYHPELHGKDITITTPGTRSMKNIELVGGLAVGAAVLLGLGAFYNLDSQSAANAVSANVGVDLMSRVTSSGRVWTPDDQSNYDRAHDSAVKAGIFYGVGGAVLIGAVVTLIVTQPKDETTIIHPHSAAPTVAPTPGGAVLGGAWSF